MEGSYGNPAANATLMLGLPPFEIGNKTRMPALTVCSQRPPGGSGGMRQQQEIKDNRIGKGEEKLSLSTDITV